MFKDTKDYWNQVRTIAESHPGPIFITSLDSARMTSEVYPERGARFIVEGTHRLSTDEDVAAYKADAKARVDSYHVAEMNKKQAVRIEMDTQGMIQTAVAAGIAAATKEAGRPGKGA
jgi:hypothetical protein